MSDVKNSEMLFIYGAELCNPNGDPDEENKPRIDPRTNINLVSDLRLKRYVRDYIIKKFGEKYVWVTTIEGKNVTAEDRGGKLLDQWKDDKTLKMIKEKKGEAEEWVTIVPKLCIDARMFGALITIRPRKKGGAETEEKTAKTEEKTAKTEKGASAKYTGPVQFSWGYSLHPVEVVESSTITSIFVGREAVGEGEQYGTMGKDWRLYYSLIAFYGIVSGMRGKDTWLKESDVKILDNILWDSLKLGATTRTKIGQTPHLYLRVEYKDKETLIGDLRYYIGSEYEKQVRKLSDIKLSYSDLLKKLKEYASRIEKVYIRESGEINWVEDKSLTEALEKELKGAVIRLPHEASVLSEENIVVTE
ncbi:MAG: type I-B CRISPR-associated protein Cas7/Csh2 [Candidatus Jordarchaeaceae archaeon]